MKPRVLIGVAGGCLFLAVWIAGAMVLSDRVLDRSAIWQLAYFAAAGSLWVLPITWLMFWAARSPRPQAPL